MLCSSEDIESCLDKIYRWQRKGYFRESLTLLCKAIQYFHHQEDSQIRKQKLSHLRMQFNRCLMAGSFKIDDLSINEKLKLDEIIEMIAIKQEFVDEPTSSEGQLSQKQDCNNNSKFHNYSTKVDDSQQKSEEEQHIKVKILQDRSYADQLPSRILWNFAELFYQQHKIDVAYQICRIIQKKQNMKDLRIDQNQFFNKVCQQYAQMIEYYNYFQEKDYEFDKEQDGIKLFYKINSETKEISILIDARVDISIEHFLAIATQIDLFQHYVPFNYQTKTIKNIKRNQKLGSSKVYIPLITDRQAYFKAIAYDRLHTSNSIFMYSKTIINDIDYQKKVGFTIPQQSDLVRFEYKFFIVEYIPLIGDKARIRLSSNADLKLRWLPMWILSKSGRVFSFDYFKNIVQTNHKFEGSLWEQKIKENPELYSFFRKQIDLYFGR